MIVAHNERLQRLDPLLPAAQPLPSADGEAVRLSVPGGKGLVETVVPDPDSYTAAWGAARQYLLRARVGADPVAAMAGLLDGWERSVATMAAPGDTDSEAGLTWPSRDTAMTELFLAHGLAPKAVVAARPAGRPIAMSTTSTTSTMNATGNTEPVDATDDVDRVVVRDIAPDDTEIAVRLGLEVVEWDSRFSPARLRPSTETCVRADVARWLAAERPWAWVAEVSGRVVELAKVDPPQDSSWVAPLIAADPIAYIGTQVVAAEHRGGGVGTALIRAVHSAFDEAGGAVTLLHYAALNPLSGPFWHRCGYRPLWTSWSRCPAISCW